MLHVRHEDDRLELLRKVDIRTQLLRNAQPKYALQLVDHRGHARTRCDDHIIRTSIDVLLDDLMRAMVRLRHQSACDVRLRMRIADEWRDELGHLLLDRAIESAASCPICVEQFLLAIRTDEGLVLADDVLAVLSEVAFERHEGREIRNYEL
jgi:hypothetical protein